MAPSRRTSRASRATIGTPPNRGGIRRSQRERFPPSRLRQQQTIVSGSIAQDATAPAPPASDSSIESDGTLEAESSPAETQDIVPDPPPHPSLTSLQQMEERLLSRILSRIDNPPSSRVGSHPSTEAAEPTLRTHHPDRRQDRDRARTYSPSTCGSGSFLGESASAMGARKSVESLFPGVERGTLTQIIENRFKPTNIYRLLASEKDKAEAQRVTIGGISFEQGEREGRESEYRMGPFFKAWAAYCGILSMLAPVGLQGELGCSLFIYMMNLQGLAEKYSWEGVKAYHFQFHRKRVASGQEIYAPGVWRILDAQLIASECFPSSNRTITMRATPFPTQATSAARVTSAPLLSQTDARPATQNAPCRNWNHRECRMTHCRYLHTCINCGGGHRAVECSARSAGPAVGGAVTLTR